MFKEDTQKTCCLRLDKNERICIMVKEGITVERSFRTQHLRQPYFYWYRLFLFI